MKKNSLLLALLLSMTVLLTACSSKNASMGSAEAPNEYAPSVPGYTQKDEAWDTGSDTGYGTPPSMDSDIYNDPNAKVIRTAEITLQTTEFDAAVAALNDLTKAQGGYYETAEVNSGGYYDTWASRSGYYVVRVPKENFTAFRDGISGVGHIYSISENSVDVGETYYDTEARLATLTTKRDRLLALLEQAEKMEDIITLENALADVQYQIDMHTTTLRKYDSLIGYATFRIRLSEVVKLTEEPSVKESFGSRLVSSLKAGVEDFGQAVQSFVLWLARNLIGVVILAVIVAAAVIVTCRQIRRRKAHKQGQ